MIRQTESKINLGVGVTAGQEPDRRRFNTVAMLGQAYSLLGFRIVDGVVGSGHPIKPSHSAVFAQIEPEGSRLTKLAAGANITPQSMGVIVDELEELGYVERRPDPTDRRAKLITLTASGEEAVTAGQATITGLEEELVTILGERGARQLRTLLGRILASDPQASLSSEGS
jgi:DNA-binding MarR family transcriptional regulator